MDGGGGLDRDVSKAKNQLGRNSSWNGVGELLQRLDAALLSAVTQQSDGAAQWDTRSRTGHGEESGVH